MQEYVKTFQQRLADLSWFMKCLNEPIAGLASGCSNLIPSPWWESRFKSQAQYTGEVPLSCMVYVDLNPMRATVAETL